MRSDSSTDSSQYMHWRIIPAFDTPCIVNVSCNKKVDVEIRSAKNCSFGGT